MSARSLFNIILKVFGITLIKDVLLTIPATIGVLYTFGVDDFGVGLTELLFTAVMVFIYCVVIYYLVFRTEYLIDKFRLAEKVPEDPVPLNLHRSTVLTIAVLVVGLGLVVIGIPEVLRGLYSWYQYHKRSDEFFDIAPYEYTHLIVYAAEIILGLLLIGNERLIVNFIEARQRRKDRG